MLLQQYKLCIYRLYKEVLSFCFLIFSEESYEKAYII